MIVAIDPGDKHVGMAVSPLDGALAWTCSPDECIDWLWDVERGITHLVVEDFMLYPWLAGKQSFSQFDTPKLIGKIELVAARVLGVEVTFQTATIKKPTFGIMKSRGVSLSGDIHAKDAQAHLYYYRQRANLAW